MSKQNCGAEPLAGETQRGASLTEYALLLALIAVAALGAFTAFSGSQGDSIGGSADKVTSAMGSGG